MLSFFEWLLRKEGTEDDIVSYLLSGAPPEKDNEFARKATAAKNPADILNKLRQLRTKYGAQIKRIQQQALSRLKTNIQRDLQQQGGIT